MGANDFLSPGVTIREVRSGAPVIRGVPTSVGGMVGRTLRGPVAYPVRLSSFAQFVRIFGSYSSNSYAAESVQAFFAKAGAGGVLYFIRVLGSSGGANAKAAVTLSSSTAGATSAVIASSGGAFPAFLLPGATFLLSLSGAGSATATIQATQATKTGAGATYAAPTAGHTLVVSINGVVGNQTISFAGTESTQALWHDAINNVARGFTVINAAGQTKLETTRRGSTAGGSIVSGSADVLASLGLTTGVLTNAGPNNVPDSNVVLATDLAAVFTAAYAGSTWVGNNTTNAITGTSNSSGAGVTLQFTSGTGVASITGFDNAVHSGAASGGNTAAMTFTSAGEGSDNNLLSVVVTANNAQYGNVLATTISPGSVTQVTLTATALKRIAIGDTLNLTDATTSTTIRGVIASIQTNNVVFQTATTATGTLNTATTVVTNETFTIAVLYNGTIVMGPITGNRMSPLSAQNYFVTNIGGPLPSSLGVNQLDPENVVTVADLSAALTGNVDNRPVNVSTAGFGDPLTGGTEANTFADTDYIGQNATVPFTGIYATKPLADLRMLAIPGISGTSTPGFVSKTLVQYCESQTSLVGIIAPPLGTTPANTATYKQTNIGATSYGIMYYPWVQIISVLSGVKALSPPEGYVMGMIANTDSNNGVQEAPAGDSKGKLTLTVDVERVLSIDDKNLLYPLNINPIENIVNVGQCVEGSRTMEDGTYNQVSVRRTFIFLEQSLLVGSRFVIFEPNTAATRAKLKRATDNFLEAQWRQGVLDGATITDAFNVICDETNNPQVIINAQQMVEDVLVNVPLVVENLVINIGQKTAA